MKLLKPFAAAMAVAVSLSLFAAGVRADSGVDDFVTRCYQVALGRDPEAGGFKYWTGQLNGRKIDGSIAAFSFIFSDEYVNKKTSDEQFVTDLYSMFMGRAPEQGGYDFWVSMLKAGESRMNVFAGFANSDEFYEICKNCGITAGYYVGAYQLDRLNLVNLFVERLYTTCLGRIGDKGGQIYWTEGLMNGSLTGIDCAANFIRSEEYKNKNLSDDEYVNNMYAAFLGRTADPTGLENWKNELAKGSIRDQIFEGFANSDEFGRICESYGIVRGQFKATTSVDGDGITDVFDLNNTKIKTHYRNADGSIEYTRFYEYDNGRVSVERDYSTSHVLLRTTTHKFDEAGHEVEKRTVDGSNALLSYDTYEYEGDALKVHKNHYASGNLNYSEVFADGKLTNVEHYFDGGKVSQNDEYKDGRKVKTTNYNNSGVILSTTEYEYDGDNVKKSNTVYYSNGHITRSEESDSRGFKTAVIFYYTDGNVNYWYKCEYYDNGKVKTKTQYDPYDHDTAGKPIFSSFRMDRHIVYIREYDMNGNQIRYTNYPKAGSKERVVKDYDTKGNVIRTVYYNADGSVDRVVTGQG